MSSNYERWSRSRPGRFVVCMLVYLLIHLILRHGIGVPFLITTGINVFVLMMLNFTLSDWVRKNERAAKLLSFGKLSHSWES